MHGRARLRPSLPDSGSDEALPSQNHIALSVWITHVTRLPNCRMIFSTANKARSNRFTVWLTLGSLLAMGVLVAAVLGFRPGPRWLRPIATFLPDRFTPAGSPVDAIIASRDTGRGPGVDDLRSRRGVGSDMEPRRGGCCRLGSIGRRSKYAGL